MSATGLAAMFPSPTRIRRHIGTAAGAVSLRQDALAMGALLALVALIGVAALVRRPDLYADAAFLFGDHSLNLLVAERLAAGGELYEDIAYQYGPLPAYGFTAWALIFGTTVASYNFFLLAVTLLNFALVYVLVRRVTGPALAAGLAGLGMIPSLLLPGSLLGGYTVSAYLPLERTVLLLVALVWAPPLLRSPRRSLAVGAALGLWQGVKFGGAVFGGVAVVLVDLLAIAITGRSERDPRAWLRSLIFILAGFLLVQGVIAAYAFATLPRAIALDFLWPAYALDTYSAWVSTAERWPGWQGWRVFVGQYLTPVVGGLAGLWMVGTLLRRGPSAPRRDLVALCLLLPLAMFVVSSFGYFRQVHHFLQFAWALVLPLGWLLARGAERTRAAVALLLLPCFALTFKATLLNPPDPSLRATTTPSGETLWLSEPTERDIEALLARAGVAEGEAGRSRPPEILFFSMGAGMQHFYDVPVLTRQPWFLPGFVRPYDEGDILSAVGRSAGVVLIADPDQAPDGGDPCATLGTDNPFSAATCEELRLRFGTPEEIGGLLYFPRS